MHEYNKIVLLKVFVLFVPEGFVIFIFDGQKKNNNDFSTSKWHPVNN